MAEYIERERLVKHYENCIDEVKNTNGITEDFEICLKALKNQHAADVVEVVRCKDCINFDNQFSVDNCGWCDEFNCGTSDENFCSYGKRKEGDDNG